MRQILAIPLVLALTACQNGGEKFSAIALELEVDSPIYASFAGDDPVVVSGRVTDPKAVVWVEGHEVVVGTDGSFRVEVPVDGPYRIIDIEAAAPEAHLRERVPVFSGQDPLETWPGALSLRITPLGLAALGDSLEATIDDLGWEDALGGLIPPIESDTFAFVPVGLTHDPTDVLLVPAEDGLYLGVVFTNVVYEAEYLIPLLGEDTLKLGFEYIEVGIDAIPEVDANGALALRFGATTIALGEPILETGTIDPIILEDLLAPTLAGLGASGASALSGLFAGIGSLSLGAPIAFDTNLLGTDISIGVDDLFGDIDGMGLVLGMALGEAPPAASPTTPTTADGHWASHAVMGLHEGLFQLLLTSDLIELLEQDIVLDGVLGDVLGLTILSLDGGHAAPDVDGWCIKVLPGDARVARLVEGTAPMAVMYMPDLQFDIGYNLGEQRCEPWLQASVAMEIGIGLTEGTALDLDLVIAEGVVTRYETTGDYDDAEVVAGLGELLDSVMSLLGGSLGFDLGDILGGSGTTTGVGALGIGELQLLEHRPILDDEGQPVDGLFALSLRLFE